MVSGKLAYKFESLTLIQMNGMKPSSEWVHTLWTSSTENGDKLRSVESNVKEQGKNQQVSHVKQLKTWLLESATELKVTGRDLWESSEHGRWSIEDRQTLHRQKGQTWNWGMADNDRETHLTLPSKGDRVKMWLILKLYNDTILTVFKLRNIE
jgi:hypothetical protein